MATGFYYPGWLYWTRRVPVSWRLSILHQENIPISPDPCTII